MKKLSQLVFFLICLVGGLLWGVCMFLSMEAGDYTPRGALIWILGGGACFGILFWLAMNAVFLFSQWNEKRKRKALEKVLETLKPCEYAFHGAIHYRKNENCTALICFHLNRITVAFVRGFRISVVEVFYSDMASASLFMDLFCFRREDYQMSVFLEITPEEKAALRKFLVDYGVNRETCFDTTGRLFFRPGEMENSEFRRLVFRAGGAPAGEIPEDALVLNALDQEQFNGDYRTCFPEADDFDISAYRAYSAAEAASVLAALRERRPAGWEDLARWLEESPALSDGFSVGPEVESERSA